MTKITTVLDKYPSYNAVIGIEVHVQLKTNSKIYCQCPNQFGSTPNTNICPICAGHPGVLPVLNKKVVDFAIMAGLACNCKIRSKCNFARKHYNYPDLPKNYQVTQAENPIAEEGFIEIERQDGTMKKIRLVRIHMEEDAGKNIHTSFGESWVDLNRAGTPLLEVVGYPDLSSSYEAKEYLKNLHSIVRYLGISDANMEEGSFRADINISVNKKDVTEYGTKVELKNINSFKFITQAIEHEVERQILALESGQKIHQETRQWDSKNHETVFMRSKEVAQDYRYFTEPDLPEIEINSEWLETIRKQIPELPHEKATRLKSEYGLSSYEADILIEDVKIADFFEKTSQLCSKPKQVCNWILRDVLSFLKENNLAIDQTKITSENLSELVMEIENGTINSKVAQEIFIEMAATGKAPKNIISEKGLQQIDSTDEIEKIIISVIAQSPDVVEKYKSGNERMFQFFVGQTMKESKGKANPKIVADLLLKHLKN